MKKTWIVLLTLLAAMLFAGCQQGTAIPADSVQDTELEPASSFSGSKTEPTESESESSEETEQSEVSATEEPPIAETSAKRKEPSESNPTSTESESTVTIPEKNDDTGTKPSEAPQTTPEPEPVKPAETVSESKPEVTVTPEPTKEPEPTLPPAPEPKSIYDYEFDVEAIRQELIAVGTGMGLTHTGDMTPNTASWSNPITASQNFQGSGLERSLKDYVRSMPDIISMYGGTTIQYFTIYAEPLDGGSYRFYFLY